MGGAFSLCYLSSHCESLGVQARVEKLVVKARVREPALEARVVMHSINRSA